MKVNEFDNIFKDKLQDFSSHVPEDMWNRIAQDKRRKRPLAFWFTNSSKGLYIAIASLLLIGGGASVWNYIHNKTTTPTIIALNPITLNNINKNKASEKAGFIDKTEEQLVKGNSNSIDQTYMSSTNDVSAISTIKSVKADVNSDIQNNVVVKNEASSSTNIKSSIGNTDRFKGKISGIKHSNIIGVKSGLNNTNNTVSKVVIQQNDNKLLVSSDANEISNINEEVESSDINKSQHYDLSVVTLNKIKLSLSKLNIKLSKPKQFSCPQDKNSIIRNWYIEVYGSPEYNFKTITNKSSSSNYIEKKDSSESMLMGYNFGVRLMRNITKKLYFKTGLQYSQYNENFSVKREDESKVTTVIINKIISRPQGDTTISDTSSFTQVGYSVTRTVNQYRNIEIPLILSFRSDNDESTWCWSVSGGVILNALSWNTGNTIDTSLGVVPINSKGTSNVYSNSSFGVSLMLAGSVERKLNDNWTLFTEPYFRYGLSNNIVSKFGFEQKFNSLGVSLGIRYKF